MTSLWIRLKLLSSLEIFVIVLCMLVIISPSMGQFPAICAPNATKPDAVCCPTPVGEVFPCGAPYRGYCLPLDDVHEVFSPPLPNHMQDDRINWPKAFFKYACSCQGNFAGYMCQECKFGYYGQDCYERRIQKRKNILTLPKEEQQRFVELLHKAKFTLSEYVVINLGPQDPIVNVTFTPVSIYDFFIFNHYYASRSTYINETHPCLIINGTNHRLDMAHMGSGFPLYHRALTLLWERALQKLAKDDTFMIPYWDWIDNGNECPVCTNELLGAVNKSHPFGYLDKGSNFYNWYTLCVPRYNTGAIRENFCRLCDPKLRAGGIVRRPGRDFPRLPILEEVEEALAMPKYDDEPYNTEAPDHTFRNCFEGNCGRNGLKYGIHNLVHGFFSGTLSGVTSSTNDPLFLLHHSFVDKLFEIWLRRHRPHKTQIPEYQAPLGHNRGSILVPFFPRHFVHHYFVDSRSLGFDYDNFDLAGKKEPHPDTYMGYTPSSEAVYWQFLLVPLAVFFCLLALVMMLERQKYSLGMIHKFKEILRDRQRGRHVQVPTEDPGNVASEESDSGNETKEVYKADRNGQNFEITLPPKFDTNKMPMMKSAI